MVVDAGVVVLTEVLTKIGAIGLWVQTVGIIVILWVAFQIIHFFFERSRAKGIYKIKEDMKRMEGKLDLILKKR